MLVEGLSETLSSNVKNATEIWIATAMINDEGYKFIQSIIPSDTKQNYLIGIDLPTTPSVLESLFEDMSKNPKITAGIYHSKSKVFHPKVYLIKSITGYHALIGSANLTGGGISKNIEMNYQIIDSNICLELKKWFDTLFYNSFELTVENIGRYKNWYSANEIGQKPSNKPIELISRDILEQNIDFTDRYFKKEHHDAFREENWRLETGTAISGRKKTRDRFLELHETIYKRFDELGMNSLYPNKKGHIVSMHYHLPGRTSQDLKAMWLSYGKSPNEIKEYHKLFPKVEKYSRNNSEEDDLQSFINHSRLQVRLENTEIGIWILFGKNNGGSMFDRDFFRKEMNKEAFRINFFDLLTSLPPAYWILVNNKKRDVNVFQNPSLLHEFCIQDNLKCYFSIGRDYKIIDEEMSENNLPETVLTEFKSLFPIYNMMTHRLSQFA